MEKLIKTLDKTLPSWVDDLFPDVSVKDDKHLISSYVKPAEDKIGLNRFQLHHFEEPTTATATISSSSSASLISSSLASAAAQYGGGVKRKRGNSAVVALLSSSKKQSSSKKNAAAAETPQESPDASLSSSSLSLSDNDPHVHYTVLNQLLGGNRLTMYDFIEKAKKGTEILLLLPGGGINKDGISSNNNKSGSGGGGGHYDAKLRSLLQASHYKVPVVSRLGDDSSSSSGGGSGGGDKQLFYVFRGSLVRVERHNGFFHGVTLARNPPNIILEIPTGNNGSGSNGSGSGSSSVTCLTFNMLKCVHDFQIWTPYLHRDFEASFSGLIWKKILAPHGNGQNYAERNRLIASLIKLVADDPIRTAQVCGAARSVQEKITSKKLSNALRSLDTKSVKQIMSMSTTTTSSSSSSSSKTAPVATTKAAAAAAAARSNNKKKQEKSKEPPPAAEPQPRKRRASTAAAAAAAAAPAAKKKRVYVKRRGTATSTTTATSTITESSTTTTAAAAAAAADKVVSSSSPAEVSILSANSGMQRLLDAADVADSLDERDTTSSSFEEQEESCCYEEQTNTATNTPHEQEEEQEEVSSFLVEEQQEQQQQQQQQGEQQEQQPQQQEHHNHQEGGMELPLLLGLKHHKDPLGFLCSVVVDKPIVNLAGGGGAFADTNTSSTLYAEKE